MRHWVWTTLLAAATMAGAPSRGEPSAAPPQGHLITNPDWAQRPGPEDFARFWPPYASSTGVVAISCEVTKDGGTTDCVVLDEQPGGEGFGDAALKIARLFKLKPKTLDGVPVAGGRFETRIKFQYPDVRPPGWARQPTMDELRAVWPKGARDISGQAELGCEITPRGIVRFCSVRSETPIGKGFGLAALKLAQKLQMTPMTDEKGNPTSGTVVIPITFKLPKPSQAGTAVYGSDITALTNAPWTATPSPADMSAAWPKGASTTLAAGLAVLNCRFTTEGRLDQCAVSEEDPPGAGLGEAALGLAGKFRVAVAAEAATVVTKARISLRFAFTNPSTGPAGPARIEHPAWVKFIAADTVTSLYPEKATKAGVAVGHGSAECVVGPDGSMTGCSEIGEDPPGLDFGKAAVAAGPYFAVNLWTDDGRPSAGAKVRLAIKFVQAEDEPPAPAASGGTAAPPAKAGGSP